MLAAGGDEAGKGFCLNRMGASTSRVETGACDSSHLPGTSTMLPCRPVFE